MFVFSGCSALMCLSSWDRDEKVLPQLQVMKAGAGIPEPAPAPAILPPIEVGAGPGWCEARRWTGDKGPNL